MSNIPGVIKSHVYIMGCSAISQFSTETKLYWQLFRFFYIFIEFLFIQDVFRKWEENQAPEGKPRCGEHTSSETAGGQAATWAEINGQTLPKSAAP